MVTEAATTRGAATVRQASVSLTVAGYAAAVVLAVEIVHDREWSAVAPVLLAFGWLVAASLAVRARPEHPAALLFVGLGTGHLVGYALGQPLDTHAQAGGWGAWTTDLVGLVCFGLGFASVAAFLATYPTGLPGTRVERWFVRSVFPFTVALVLADLITARRPALVLEGTRSTMPAPDGLPLGGVHVSAGGVVPLLVVAGLVLLLVRSRRVTGEDRAALTWAAGAGGLLALMIATNALVAHLFSPDVASTAFVVVAVVLPFVLLAGVVRYRSMEVDLYVTRTLASGLVVALALAAYAVVASATADNRGATALVVVLAALTGVPLVRALSRLADRWLSGGRVRGHALLASLDRSLRESLVEDSPAALARRTTEAVAAGLGVAWVRTVGPDLDAAAGVAGGEPALVVPLVAGDEQVGRLECGPRHGGWSTAAVREVEVLAGHAALAIHNASLDRRLAAQVEELTASRTRLAQAELDVRRRLERDLHDGVQQQVVALMAHVGALQLMVERDSPAAGLVATVQQQAAACLRELREVVSGVHPPVLLDRGVVAAVESRADLLPIPVEVRSTLAGRAPAESEAAAYYVVSEALTNVVKHARASRAEVCFEPEGGWLRVSVRDDGRGLSPDAQRRGLTGLQDRVEALGGRLHVESGPHGTRVSAWLPGTAEVLSA